MKLLYINSSAKLNKQSNQSMKKLSPLKAAMLDEIEAKVKTQDHYNLSKELDAEFPIKEQQEISKILSINLDTTHNNKTFIKQHEFETPTNLTLISNKEKFPDLTIFNFGALKPKINSSISNIIQEKFKGN